MADETTTGSKSRRGARREAPPVPEVTEAQRPAAAAADPAAAAAGASGALVDEGGDAEGRQKVQVGWIVARSERMLGIPTHELIGALHGREHDEYMTLNAVRKAHAEWLEREQNPTTEDEEE